MEIFIPKYLKKALDRLQHLKPKRTQYGQHLWAVPAYGKDLICHQIQMIEILLTRNSPRESNPFRSPCYIVPGQFIQKCCNQSMKYHVSNQNQRRTPREKKKLLGYAETYPNVVICYKAINMVLHVDSDSAYPIMPETRNCFARHLYMSDWPSPWT